METGGQGISHCNRYFRSHCRIGDTLSAALGGVERHCLAIGICQLCLRGVPVLRCNQSWKEAGFDPLLGAWDTSKAITREGWERSAALFEKFEEAAEQAWVETKETAQEAWDRTKTGAGGITVGAGSVLQRGVNWLKSKVSSGDICDYSLVEIDDYSVAEIYTFSPAEICD